MFDVGQQKNLFAATGNSPTEPLNCKKLLVEESSKEKGQGEALATTGTIHRVFISGSVDRSGSPQGYNGLPSSLSLTHTLTLFYSAYQSKCSLFPNCNSLFLFHPRQYLEDLCPHSTSLRS